MSKTILIVESDAALSRTLRTELEQKGFSVEETTDGKGSVELIRRLRPALVVMAVDLSAGQNGYILCGKLKKDDELRTVPIIIMGNRDGFAQHSKLKTRADDYVAKPVDPAALVGAVRGLIGLPEPRGGGQGREESLTAADLLDEAEEISVDADLDRLDDAFADISGPVGGLSPASRGSALAAADPLDMGMLEEPVQAPAESTLPGEEEYASLDVLDGGEDAADSALAALGTDEPLSALDEPLSAFDEPLGELPLPEPPRPRATTVPPPPAPTPRAGPVPPASVPPTLAPAPMRVPPARPAPPPTAVGPADGGELRTLRAQVTELQAALQDARERLAEGEGRVQALEAELERKSTELETARASGGKADKEFFALRESANRKDKEILRLKSELNERDQELLNLREREMQLEQQVSESAAEVARRDAQLRTLTTKVEQLVAERRRLDQQLQQAREEAREATARASALELELPALQDRLQELEALRSQVEGQASLRQQLEEVRREAQAQRSAAEQARSEAESMRQELEALRTSSQRSDERLTRLYARLKADERLRERTRKALAIAQQLLDEQPAKDDSDEAAA